MTPCSNDTTLRRFIEALLAPGESEAIEAHIEECAACRARLDLLAGVPELGSLVASVPRPSLADSPSLLAAMKQLEIDGGQTVSSESIPNSTVRLKPSNTAGSIGRLGGIEIRRVLGRGAMGIVYEGFEPALHRTVAVKVLSPELLGDVAAKDRFVREARSAAALTHENVVAIHAIGEAEDVPYLVLQYVDGESLADRLTREKKLVPDEMARIGIQVARALEAAHSVGLIHRDIKPANILVETDTGRVRLADFGLAKAVGGANITHDGTLAGTPAYMAPEQTLGTPLDGRADLFSLGVVLYQGVAGVLPFAGDSPFLVLDKIRRGSYKPLRDVDPALPTWYCDIVDALLANDLNARIGSATEVAKALTERSRIRRPSTLRRRVFLYSACVLFLLVFIGSGFYWLREPTNSSILAPTMSSLPTGFFVQGISERFENLNDALAVAAEEATIEVHGDGPFPCSRIEVKNKRLTIQAGKGFRPVFRPAEGDGPPTQNWITSAGELTLDGIDIEWPVGASANVPISLEEGVIMAPAVTLTNCRIKSGNRGYCVNANTSLSVDRCYLLSDRAGGRCIGLKVGGTLTLSRTICEAKVGIVFRPGAASNSKVEVLDSTFRCEMGFLFVILPPFANPMELTVRRSVIDTENVVCLLHGNSPIAKKMSTTVAKASIQKLVRWSEEENVYRRKTNYLVTWTFQRAPVSAEIQSLGDWTSFWNLPDPKSIAADLRFRPRPEGSVRTSPPILDRLEQPTGAIPMAIANSINGP